MTLSITHLWGGDAFRMKITAKGISNDKRETDSGLSTTRGCGGF